MSNVIAQLQAQLLFLRRFRWQGIAAAWLVCLIGWLAVAALPEQYVSTARVYVDTESMLRPLMKGIAPDSTLISEIEMMQRTLLSKPNLQKVARSTGLDPRANTPAAMNELLASVERRIKLVSQGKNLISLTFEDRNPEMAKRVVEALLNLFMETNIGAARRDTVAAIRFIDEQIRSYEVQLEQAENKVAAFKSQNMGFLPGDNNYTTRLEGARVDVGRTQAELKERVLKRDALRHRLSEIPQFLEAASWEAPGGGPPIAIGPAGSSFDIDLRIAEVEKELDGLLRKFTERHPDVLAARRALEKLKRQAAEYEQAERSAAESGRQSAQQSGGKPTVPNPIYSQLQVQLVTEESELAALEGRLERQQSEMRKWEQLARTVPNVAAEMARLSRDYDVLKRNYDELLSRRESAKMAQDLDTQTDKVQFRIVDPPQVPTVSTGPKRRIFLAAVWLVALASGAAFAVSLGYIKQCVATVTQLQAIIGRPVLGGVSFIAPAGRRGWRAVNHLAFAAVALALCGAFGGVMALEMLRGFKLPLV